MVSLTEASKYPFTITASEKMKEFQVSLDMLEKEHRTVLDRAVERIKESIMSGTIRNSAKTAKDELLSFSVAFMLVEYIDDIYLKRRWAFAEADRAHTIMAKDVKDNIYVLATDQFKWNMKKEQVEYDGTIYDYQIYFTDYLRNSVAFNEPKWKLVNRVMNNGFLALSHGETVRLLRTEVYELLMGRLIVERSYAIPRFLQGEAMALERYLLDNKPEYTDELPLNMEAIPPCIAKILRRLQRSFNLSHTERFALTSFLLKIGMNVKTVIQLYNVSPDFKEDLTSYQVKQIKERDYTPPACASMKTNRLCEDDGTVYCKKAKHPLSHYAMKNFTLEKKK